MDLFVSKLGCFEQVGEGDCVSLFKEFFILDI